MLSRAWLTIIQNIITLSLPNKQKTLCKCKRNVHTSANVRNERTIRLFRPNGFQIWLLSKNIDLNSRGAVTSGVGRGVSICASANKLVLGWRRRPLGGLDGVGDSGYRLNGLDWGFVFSCATSFPDQSA